MQDENRHCPTRRCDKVAPRRPRLGFDTPRTCCALRAVCVGGTGRGTQPASRASSSELYPAEAHPELEAYRVWLRGFRNQVRRSAFLLQISLIVPTAPMPSWLWIRACPAFRVAFLRARVYGTAHWHVVALWSFVRVKHEHPSVCLMILSKGPPTHKQ